MNRKKIYSVGFGIFLLVLWEVLSLIIDDAFIMPSPQAVIHSLIENRLEIFTEHFPATMEVVLLGGVLSILFGMLFAILMDAHKSIERAVYPILTVTQTVPVMCVAPVFVLWLGYSVKMRVLVVILTNFFPVTVNLFDGLKSTREDRTELLETYGASKWQKFIMLRMPTALPYFFSSLRVALPWSVVAAAISEWLGAPKGLGTYSRYCMMNLDAAGLLAPLIVLTVVALILNALLKFVEKKVITWQ
ncbi:MAG: ABC transporter permease [Lachnospiraceae bacterium]|nr:ABC transporter permease [Lachnospiraceae bacterium]